AEELAAIDAEWGNEWSDGPPDSGTFGHTERRLGLRVPAACWALLTDGNKSAYARAVELSPTGAVLELFDGHALELDGHAFELDLFVPSIRPVHATARPVRAVGGLEAFEFSNMNAADRLTLAEHLDDIVSRRRISKPPEKQPASTPPVSWKNFVLSLKRSAKPTRRESAVDAQRL
ncbi:MAG TPA: hypothetical protein VF103_17805, partial [Polyangiaceae bacterium]